MKGEERQELGGAGEDGWCLSPASQLSKPESGDKKKSHGSEVVEGSSGASIGENFPFVTEPRETSQVGGRAIPTLC